MKPRVLVNLTAIAGLLGASAAQANETVSYRYDARGRLIEVVRPNDSGQKVRTCYAYDNADNRTNVTTTVFTGTPPPCP